MTKKIAYLTIDDSPSIDMKGKIDFLFSKGIPAVWFCKGDFLEQSPEHAIHAIRKDFVIGNHSYNHLYFSDLPLKQCFEEIQKTDNVIDEVYKMAGVKSPAKFFRFPHGDKGGLKYKEVFEKYESEGKIRKENVQDYLRSIGYKQPKFEKITYRDYRKAGLLDDVDWHWTFDVLEWTIFTEDCSPKIDSLEDAYKRIDKYFGSLDRSISEEIILIHDHPESTHMFQAIIERLLDMSIIFKSPSVN